MNQNPLLIEEPKSLVDFNSTQELSVLFTGIPEENPYYPNAYHPLSIMGFKYLNRPNFHKVIKTFEQNILLMSEQGQWKQKTKDWVELACFAMDFKQSTSEWAHKSALLNALTHSATSAALPSYFMHYVKDKPLFTQRFFHEIGTYIYKYIAAYTLSLQELESNEDFHLDYAPHFEAKRNNEARQNENYINLIKKYGASVRSDKLLAEQEIAECRPNKQSLIQRGYTAETVYECYEYLPEVKITEEDWHEIMKRVKGFPFD